jgi:hypothetical protein
MTCFGICTFSNVVMKESLKKWKSVLFLPDDMRGSIKY